MTIPHKCELNTPEVYNSLNGPTANPSTYTDTMKPANISSVEWNVFITSGTPGANMLEASGVKNVIADTSPTAPHFFNAAQFIGF